MYRENVGPKPPDPWAAADQNAKTIGWVQIGAIGLQTVTILLMAIQFGPNKHFLDGDAKVTLLLSLVGYLVVMGGWAAVNAWGLRKRSRIAHWSSFVFAIGQIVSCFGTVFGIGLMFLLFKKEMQGYYDERPTS